MTFIEKIRWQKENPDGNCKPTKRRQKNSSLNKLKMADTGNGEKEGKVSKGTVENIENIPSCL